MKHRELYLVLRAIANTNKSYEMCNPTVPMWTGTFALELARLLTKEPK